MLPYDLKARGTKVFYSKVVTQIWVPMFIYEIWFPKIWIVSILVIFLK
jgi:hypothetical protein